MPEVEQELTGVAVLAMVDMRSAVELAIPGGERPEEMHATVGYLRWPAASYIEWQKQDLTRRLGACWRGAFTARVFAFAQFNPDADPNGADDPRYPCATVLVQSVALARVHILVQIALGEDQSTDFPIWVPHITIGYNKSISDIPPEVVGKDLTFDRLVLNWAGEQIVLGAHVPW